MSRLSRPARALLPLAGLFALAACQADEPEFEVDAEDRSGGELIATPADREGVEVELPETEMTMVPEGEIAEQDSMATE